VNAFYAFSSYLFIVFFKQLGKFFFFKESIIIIYKAK
jgi:hypothetical protein